MNALTGFFLLAVGLAAGLFINYLADVMPETLAFTRPRCRACKRPISLKDYLTFRTCPECGARRSLRVWAALALSAGGLLVLAYFPSLAGRLGYWPSALLWLYCLLVSVIDIEHRLILSPLSLAGVLLCGGLGYLRHGWLETLLGGLAGFSIMFGLVWFGELIKGALQKIRGQDTDEVAFGTGDATLGGIIGLLLGWPGIAAGLTLSILFAGAGALVIVVVLWIKKRDPSFFPFAYGPFMLAAMLYLIFR